MRNAQWSLPRQRALSDKERYASQWSLLFYQSLAAFSFSFSSFTITFWFIVCFIIYTVLLLDAWTKMSYRILYWLHFFHCNVKIFIFRHCWCTERGNMVLLLRTLLSFTFSLGSNKLWSVISFTICVYHTDHSYPKKNGATILVSGVAEHFYSDGTSF